MLDLETLPNGNLQRPSVTTLIKRLFCHHEYERKNDMGRYMSIKCVKCGKEKLI